MSTDPVHNNYDSLREFPKDYIVNYTQDYSYLHKSKIYSQRLTLRNTYKSEIYIENDKIKDKLTPEKKIWQNTP
jgi:hypothetical protein